MNYDSLLTAIISNWWRKYEDRIFGVLIGVAGTINPWMSLFRCWVRELTHFSAGDEVEGIGNLIREFSVVITGVKTQAQADLLEVAELSDQR